MAINLILDVEEHIAKGWSIDKKNKKSVRLKKVKRYDVLLVDRVWSVLFRTGFKYLSLQELYAELHWDAEEPDVRVRAILSKAIKELGLAPDSSLNQRIQTADVNKDGIRCITLSSIYGALEKAQTNIKSKAIIDWIETKLQQIVIEELKMEYGSSESEWWILGVPKNVRTKVSERFEQDDAKRGEKEYYFELIDYRRIIMENCEMFEPTFAYKSTGNKEARTSWMAYVNEKRNVVSHPSSAITLTIEELDELQKYREWLIEKTNIQ